MIADRVGAIYDEIVTVDVTPDEERIMLVNTNDGSTIGNHDVFDAHLIYKSELMAYDGEEDSSKMPDKYAFDFSPRQEFYGCKVAESSLALYDHYDVACAILWEMTWFGYDDEAAETRRTFIMDSVNKAMEDIKSGSLENCKTSEELFGPDERPEDVKELEKDMMRPFLKAQVECYRKILLFEKNHL